MKALNADEYIALVGAVGALESLADDNPEVYGKDADNADRALTKVWTALSPTQQKIVNERLGIDT